MTLLSSVMQVRLTRREGSRLSYYIPDLLTESSNSVPSKSKKASDSVASEEKKSIEYYIPNDSILRIWGFPLPAMDSSMKGDENIVRGPKADLQGTIDENVGGIHSSSDFGSIHTTSPSHGSANVTDHSTLESSSESRSGMGAIAPYVDVDHMVLSMDDVVKHNGSHKRSSEVADLHCHASTEERPRKQSRCEIVGGDSIGKQILNLAYCLIVSYELFFVAYKISVLLYVAI